MNAKFLEESLNFYARLQRARLPGNVALKYESALREAFLDPECTYTKGCDVLLRLLDRAAHVGREQALSEFLANVRGRTGNSRFEVWELVEPRPL